MNKFKVGDEIKVIYLEDDGFRRIVTRVKEDWLYYAKYRADSDFEHNDSQPIEICTLVSPAAELEVKSLGPDVITWTFRGEVNYARLRDDLKAGGFRWAVVDGQVLVRSELKYRLQTRGFGFEKLCRGLWLLPNATHEQAESAIAQADAHFNLPVHKVEGKR